MCVVVDLLGLIVAYATGCSRHVETSVALVLITVVVLICVLVLVMFLQSETATVWIDNKVKPAYEKLLSGLSWLGESRLSWPRESQLSSVQQDVSQTTRQQDTELDSQQTHQEDTELDSKRTSQQDTDREVKGVLPNLKCCPADTNLVSSGDVRYASASD